MSKQAISLVKSAITPGYPLLTKIFLLPAEVFWFASLVGRKIRLFSNSKNLVPLMAGSILDAAVGKQPTVRSAARIVFGSACIVRCNEDILRIVDKARTILRIFKGQSFTVIKKKTWEDLNLSKHRSPSSVYFSKIKKVRDPILVKRFFICILEMLKSLGLLALHFADAITAFREKNTTSEIFVHGIDIFNKLTSSDSEIVKNLKRLENVSNMMLSKMGASWASTALVGLFVLPAKIRQAAPGIDELFDNFKNNFTLIREKFEAMEELISLEYLELLNKTKLLNKVPKKMVPEIERQFDFFTQGVNDPDTLRFLKKPIMRSVKV